MIINTSMYCCKCDKYVEVRLTTGKEIYPHRKDLYNLKVYIHDRCGEYVGVHKGTIKPLGCIPTNEIRLARIAIHKLIDPIWQSRSMPRSKVYKDISNIIGYKFHTANTKSLEECNNVILVIERYINDNKN